MTVGDPYITEPWIDSDSALLLAEQEGGAIFRAANLHTPSI